MNQPRSEQPSATATASWHSCGPRKPERRGGVVLCGGRSRRMGQDKTWLRFGPETMLQRVVRLLGQTVDRLVVVAAIDQQLPPLDSAICVLRDRRPGLGPLEGIAVGLAALARSWPDGQYFPGLAQSLPTAMPRNDAGGPLVEDCPIGAAFVVGCDMPLLRPALVRRMFELAVGWDLLAPAIEGHYEPLAAVYSLQVLPQVETLLAAGRRRPIELFPLVRTRLVPEDCLREADPQLQSFFNVNGYGDYRTALAWAGLSQQADRDPQVGGYP